MDEATMNMHTDGSDQWLMDGCLPNDPSLLEDLVLPKDVEDYLKALADEIFGPVDEVPTAA